MTEPQSVIPPRPEDLVRTRKISRPAVLIAISCLLALVFVVLIFSAGSGGGRRAEADVNPSRGPEMVEATAIPEILKDVDDENKRFEEEASRRRLAAQGRISAGDVFGDATAASTRRDSAASEPDRVRREEQPDQASERRARALALLQEMRERAEAAEHGGAAAAVPPHAYGTTGPGSASPPAAPGTREYYQRQLAARQAGRGTVGEEREDNPVENAFMAAASASPVVTAASGGGVLGGGGLQNGGAEAGGDGDPRVERLRQMQHVAAQGGHRELAEMIAWVARDLSGEGDEAERLAAAHEGAAAAPRAAAGQMPVGTGVASGRQQVAHIQQPLSPFEIKEGTAIPAQLVTAVNTDVAGGVRARITRNVYDSRTQQHVLIPAGSVVLGTVEGGVDVGQVRVAMVWDRILLPDGRSIELGTQETKDGIGAGGVRGQVDNHFFKRFSGALMVSLVGAGTRIATYDDQAAVGFIARPDPKAVIGRSAAEQTSEVATAMLERNINIPPTIELEEGYPFHLYLRNDIAFPGPYRSEDGFQAGW